MKVDSVNSHLITANLREKIDKSVSDNFAAALLNRMESEKDSYEETERKSVYQCENYNDLFLNATGKRSTGAIATVETERYKIVEKESGVLRVYDKEHNNECVDLKLNKENIQVDKETGTKFIINDLGAGFFTMLTVDDELEAGLKEALGVDELDETELSGFTVHTDQKTGIKYITANGYESRGGSLVLDKEAEQKLDSMAKEFLEQYPNLAKTYDEAWFYATFEVRGLLKRTSDGIMMISPNSISFKNKDGENGWVSVFDPENWGQVKEEFDSGINAGEMESWNFWKDFFERRKIDSSFIIPDSAYDRKIKDPDPQFEKFMSLCLGRKVQ
jgi:hypothetical protein